MSEGPVDKALKAFIEEMRDGRPMEELIADANEALRLAQAAVLQDRNVLEKLLTERQKLLDAIPECPEHGACVPHALEWIERAGKAIGICHDLYAELGNGGDLDWHLREDGYAGRLKEILEPAE